MPTEVRDYIVSVLNAEAAAPALDALQRLVEAYDSDIVPAANPSWVHAQNRAVGVLMRFGR
jgi:hypothetical protein